MQRTGTISRKAWHLKAGSIKNLHLVAESLAAPGPGAVQIAVKAIGLNFADTFAIWGLYSATPKGDFVPGLEYAGEVVATGPGVTQLRVGDRVMGVTRFGAYATHLNTDARYVVPMPEDWSYAEGAAYLVQGLTAWYGLVTLGTLEAGQTVLIHSAAGGVGILANRIAKQLGAYTIGTVSRAEKVPICQEEGYDQVIVRGKARHFGQQLRQALQGRELHLVMETIGGRFLIEGFKALAPMGRMVVYSSARYAQRRDRPNYLRILWMYLTRPKIDPQVLTQANKALMGFNLIWLYEKVELMHRILAQMQQVDIGKPRIGHTFPFEQAPQAIRLFQSGRTTGKVVLQVV